MNKSAISIEHLSVEYDVGKSPKFIAVDDFNVEIKKGEFLGLLGPNGAGKTSIISSMTGLLSVEIGRISVFGCPAGSREAKRQIGVVPQEVVGHGFFNVIEVLRFISGYYGISNNTKRIEELLDRLQLSSSRHKKVSQLSGGMKRRLMIAKALVHSPKILLLDEPSAGVDIELRAILWDFMQELNKAGATIVLTTHYLEEAQRLCERCAILDHGKLLALDETGSLIESLAERVVHITLKGRFDKDVEKAIDGKRILSVRKEGNTIRAVVSGGMGLSNLLERLQVPLENVLDLRTEEGDLEHAFLKVIHGVSRVS